MSQKTIIICDLCDKEIEEHEPKWWAMHDFCGLIETRHFHFCSKEHMLEFYRDKTNDEI